MQNKFLKYFLILLLAVIILAGGYFVSKYFSQKQTSPVACTMEAKLCPDGSYVGRTGPKCEFTPCLNITASWKTYTNFQYGFEIKYPAGYIVSDEIKDDPIYNYKLNQILSAESINKNYINRSILKILAGTDKDTVGKCLKNPNTIEPQENIKNTKNINGQTFYTSYEGGDAAMGGARGFVSFNHILHNNICYIINLETYYHQVGWPDNTATKQEVDLQNNAVNKQVDTLKEILSTFKFVK
jgi:hypothetical protein